MNAILRPYTLLITDDEPSSRDRLRSLFDPDRYRVLVADSGEEAIDLVRTQEVHLAMLDMNLPRLSGLDALEIVREYRRGLPAILLSVDPDEALLRRALTARVFSVLTKPVVPEVAMSFVARALRKHY